MKSYKMYNKTMFIASLMIVVMLILIKLVVVIASDESFVIDTMFYLLPSLLAAVGALPVKEEQGAK